MLAWSRNPRIRRTAWLIRQGGVVAYPTEAVWGLGCDPWNQAAVARILALKGRSVDKGLILIAADIAAVEPYLAGLSSSQREMLAATWPGPVTWLVPANGAVPEWITGGRDSLALRVTAHPVAAGLCRAFAGALVSTSANPQGLPAATSLTKVKAYFGKDVDAYAPGRVGGAIRPSEIRDLRSGGIVRAG
ncbi:MAG: L-threonylcarbamoyladenylate synthase [Porticoccaceae bacterium]